MKQFLLALSFVFIGLVSQGQKLWLRGDSIIIEKTAGNAALQIKNGTRHFTGGALVNIGNGVTEFRRVVDSGYLLNPTTFRLTRGAGTPLDIPIGGGEGGTGTDGREVELQTNATHIQWRYVGSPAWTDLIALASLQGPPGIQGPQGPQGPAGDPATDDQSLDEVLAIGNISTRGITVGGVSSTGFPVQVTTGGQTRALLGIGNNNGSDYGVLQLRSSNSIYYGYLEPANALTGSRTWLLPNKDGTVAMTSDIPSITGKLNTSDTTAMLANYRHWNAGYLKTFTETDPLVGSHIKSITTTDISNWNAKLSSFTETDPTVGAHIKSITTTEKTNWNTAFGWGNHASAGYLTSYTETDPTVPSHVKSITTTEKANWNTAFGWGNHATQGYLKTYTETDPKRVTGGSFAGTTTKTLTLTLADGSTVAAGSFNDIEGTAGTSDGNNYLSDVLISGNQFTFQRVGMADIVKSYTPPAETDPTVGAHIKSITTTEKTNWNTAFGWGNHASAGYLTSIDADLTAIGALSGTTGLLRKTAANTWSLDNATYLTSYTETDPTVGSHVKGITTTDISNWNSKLSSFTETDPLVPAHVKSITTTNISTWNAAQPGDGDLTSIAGLAGTAGFLKKTAANTWALDNSTYLTSYTETDPTVGSHVKAITTTDISNWNAKLSSFTETDPLVPAHVKSITTTEKANWNTAFGWGNHASAGYLTSIDADLTAIGALTGTTGILRKTAANTWSLDNATYLTSYTETDPTVGSHVKGITTTDITNWNAKLSSYTETDPLVPAHVKSITTTNITDWNTVTSKQAGDADLTSIAGLTGTTGLLRKTAANTWSLDNATYLTSYTETDPLVGSHVKAITTTDIANWNAKLSSFTETDPLVPAHVKSITTTEKTAWNAAQPGDADLTSIAGLTGTTGLLRKTAANTWTLETATYLTSYTETDPTVTTTLRNNWNAGYNDKINSLAMTLGTGTLVTTLTQQDGGTVSGSVSAMALDQTGLATGDMLYYNGTDMVRVRGTRTNGFVPKIQSDGFPTWTADANTGGTTLNGTGLVRMAGTSVSYDNTAYLSNITALITPGTNVTLSGSGTLASPYVINSTAAGGGGGDVYLANSNVFVRTTGQTTSNIILRNNAAQQAASSSHFLMRAQNTSSVDVAGIRSDGTVLGLAFEGSEETFGVTSYVGEGIMNGLNLNNEGSVTFANGLTWWNNPKDVGIRRSAAGVLEVFDGQWPTAATRDLRLRNLISTQNAGTGVRMAVFNADGSMGNQAIPSGAGTYSLPIASATVLGGIKVGTGLSIDGAGVLSATGGGSGTNWFTANQTQTANRTHTVGAYTTQINYSNLDNFDIHSDNNIYYYRDYVTGYIDWGIVKNDKRIVATVQSYTSGSIDGGFEIQENYLELRGSLNIRDYGQADDINQTTGYSNATNSLANVGTLALNQYGQTYLKPSGVYGTTSATSLTPDEVNTKYTFNALANAFTVNNPTAVPKSDMQALTIRLKDNGTARALTWGTMYKATDIALPTTTVVGKTLIIGFFWNYYDQTYDLVSVVTK